MSWLYAAWNALLGFCNEWQAAERSNIQSWTDLARSIYQ